MTPLLSALCNDHSKLIVIKQHADAAYPSTIPPSDDRSVMSDDAATHCVIAANPLNTIVVMSSARATLN
jgi:hypothetical protein